MPLLLRSGAVAPRRGASINACCWVRRIAILVLALIAYAYHRHALGHSLAQHGLLAFAAVAQFAPALIGGLYWRGASRTGAYRRVCSRARCCGHGACCYCRRAAERLVRRLRWMHDGPFGIAWLRPRIAVRLSGWDPLTHGVFWSLLGNHRAFVFMSMRHRPLLQDQLARRRLPRPLRAARRCWRRAVGPASIRSSELLTLAERILGEQHARRAFQEYASQQRPLGARTTRGSRAGAIHRALAGIGPGRCLRAQHADLGAARLRHGAGRSGQPARRNQPRAALQPRDADHHAGEHQPHGVSVVDADMRLVAWNRRYQQLFDYPDGMLYVGRPVADLMRWNAERGEMGAGDIEAHERVRRLEHLRAGLPHVFERVRAYGQVIELLGRALPGGGYVTSYSDITDYKRVERELREVNETLEQRVELRTREAEAAQQSKTRFLAAISHDVLQPLHAARLFASALREGGDAEEQAHLASRVDASLRAAEELLDGLLDVSRLDAGVLQPQWSDFDATELLRELQAQYAPTAAQRGLALRMHAPEGLPVRSDRRLLRRALQNFIGNACATRKAAACCWRRGGAAMVCHWRCGTPAPASPPTTSSRSSRSSIATTNPAARPARTGPGPVDLPAHRRRARPSAARAFRVGRGSVFGIRVPRASAPLRLHVATHGHRKPRCLPAGLRVLCVDNDPEILAGMRALLGRWGVEVSCASTVDDALQLAGDGPEVLLVDYHLHDRLDGLDTLDALRAACGDVPGALLTADGSDVLKRNARLRGYRVLTKPIKPASLRAFLASVRS
jgi:CheY-like chemotaxis protein